MGDSRASNSSQSLESTFDTLLEIIEADIAAIAVVKSEQLPTNSRTDVRVSVQELVYGSKSERAGISSKPLDRENELIYSSEEFLWPMKGRGPFNRLY
ncbi:hypothetical protein O181_049854 [Austropuccinia psidii MF-1]|uniref:Uncharacterized protein n=1 Tax=Austropuccinia psidii MF-1 TaxID=1389203 RepID=A0A9Q3DVM9_9BASI|nr:hypothetical protein [Austropuccinia psidii MF-1]